MPAKKQPCIVDGVRYESKSAAARALGIYVGVLKNRLSSSNFPGYVSKHHKKIKHVKRTAPLPCTIKGVEYPSIAEAARKLRISPDVVSNRLKSYDYPDYVCASIPKKLKTPKYSYMANGKKYKTLQEIADAEGVTKERIRQKMNNPKKPEYQRF